MELISKKRHQNPQQKNDVLGKSKDSNEEINRTKE